jgi:glutamyl-tRNA reductase
MAGERLLADAIAADASMSVETRCAGTRAATGLAGRNVLVVGAGSMARGMAAFVADAAVDSLVISNRTETRAESLALTLAESAGARSVRGVGLDQLGEQLAAADVVFCATDATEPVVTLEHLSAVAQGRQGRALLLVDVGMPRDVDPAAATLDGIELMDMADVAALTEANLAARRAEADAVAGIVDDELARYADVVSARQVAPVVTALRERAEGVRQAELDRFAGRLDGLSAEQREAVEALTKGMLAKLLHSPTVQLKDTAGSSRGDRLADSVRDLFDLG